jgi:hypothetical protein
MDIAKQWEVLRRRLVEEKRAVSAEIEAYPRPIAGCDAQFNHLLERRRLLFAELSRLEDAISEGSLGVETFLRDSTCLDEAAKRAILGTPAPAAARPA